MTRRQVLLFLLGLAAPLPAARQTQEVTITLIGKSFDYEAVVAELIPMINAAVARPPLLP